MERLLNWFKKYFIPHEKNEYKPHSLRQQSALAIFSLLIVIELGFLIQVMVVFDKTNFLASVLPGVLTMITNQERADNNVPPLTENSLLNQAAKMKAEDMATRGYFAHNSPDGKTPWYWLEQVGYSYGMAGENLAVNFFESSDVAKAWMNSPTHRANIVKKDYTEIGIGVANGIFEGKNTVFVAQFFGTPVIMPIIENNPPTIPKIITLSKPKTQPISVVTPSPTPVAVTPVATKVLGEEANSAVPIAVKTLTSETSSGVKLFIQKVLTSPRQYMNYAYSGIALLVVLALLLAIFIKIEIQHPKIIANGFALVAVIAILMFVNLKILHLETNIGMNDLTANAIAH